MKVMNMPPCELYAKVGKILPRFFWGFFLWQNQITVLQTLDNVKLYCYF